MFLRAIDLHPTSSVRERRVAAFYIGRSTALVRDNSKKPEQEAHVDTGELSSQGDGYAT